MKKPISVILAFMLLVCSLVACSNPPQSTKFDASLLEYPGLKWGMTPEKVQAALNLSDNQPDMKDEQGSPCLTVKDLNLFGYSLKGAKFYFATSDDGALGLASIIAYFSEETDMTQVRDAMIAIYGDGDTWSGQNYQISSSGELTPYVEAMKNANRLQHYWRVSGRVEAVVDDIDEVIAFFGKAYPQASRETIEEYLKLAHTAGIGLVDTAVTDDPRVDPSVATKNVVQFNGTGLVWYMQTFGT